MYISSSLLSFEYQIYIIPFVVCILLLGSIFDLLLCVFVRLVMKRNEQQKKILKIKRKVGTFNVYHSSCGIGNPSIKCLYAMCKSIKPFFAYIHISSSHIKNHNRKFVISIVLRNFCSNKNIICISFGYRIYFVEKKGFSGGTYRNTRTYI